MYKVYELTKYVALKGGSEVEHKSASEIIKIEKGTIQYKYLYFITLALYDTVKFNMSNFKAAYFRHRPNIL